MAASGWLHQILLANTIREAKGWDSKAQQLQMQMLKRLDCYKHASNNPKVLTGVEPPPTVCGQFKKLMEVSNTKKCNEICAGQLVTF